MYDHIGLGGKSWKLLAQTISPTPSLSLCSQKAIHLFRGEHGEIFGRLEVGWGKCGILENKSSNIYETRKDGGKVTMESL